MILDFFSTNPNLYYSFIFILGLVVGSFLNVVIYRLPRIMFMQWKDECCDFLELNTNSSTPFNLSFPASTCPICGHKIRAWENIPVVSYLFLKGKCSQCKTPISIRYPFIELISGLISLSIAIQFGTSITTLTLLIFSWMLIALFFIDFDKQLLPDDITLPLLWLGILVNSFAIFTDLHSSVFGAILGYLSLWSVYHLFRLITGKEGMGHGDFKLLAALGAWCGFQSLPLIIILSSLAGCLYGLFLFLFKRNSFGEPFPFGPFLVVAGWLSLIYGNNLNQVYLSLFSL